MLAVLLQSLSTADINCEPRSANDTYFLVVGSIIILTMQLGFALLEAGSVRTLSSVNIMQKNILDMGIGCIAWCATGWGIAYGVGTSTSTLYGTGEFFGLGITDPVMWFFQYSFAATAATIDSAAAAERMKLKYYLMLSFLTTGFIYPVVAHWQWSGDGWLAALGYIDFAGSGAVHMLGGCSALVLGLHLGPRTGILGREVPEGRISKEDVELCHRTLTGNPVYQMFGVMILWSAWYAFNGVSAFSAEEASGFIVGRVCICTTLAACASGVVGIIFSLTTQHGCIKTHFLTDSILGGLVAITSFPHAVSYPEALITGVFAGIVCYITSIVLEYVKFDDPVGAIPVHFSCGILGVLLPGFLASRPGCEGELSQDFIDAGISQLGILHGGGTRQLGTQVTGLVATLVWTVVSNLVILEFLRYLAGGNLRVKFEEEFTGLDMHEHGEDHLKSLTAQEKIARAMENLLDHIDGLYQERENLARIKEQEEAEAIRLRENHDEVV